MQLPGGLIERGERRRDFAFRPLCGALELALAEVGGNEPQGGTALTTPQAVTRALALALDRLAGDVPSTARVARLCVADRQFLMRALDAHLGQGERWFDARCARCGARFDFQLDVAQLPVVEAAATFPYTTLEIDGQRRRFRLPTGADQEVLATLPEAAARAWLARALADEAHDEAHDEPADDLDALAIAALDAALEAVAPAVVLAVEASCPECGHANAVDIDPYRVLAREGDDILREVHEIAVHYHWGEAEILGLPRERRRHYLRLIAAERGLTS